VTDALDASTGEVVELLQALIRNRCVNDGTTESGQEVRSAEVLQAVLEEAGVAVERHESAPGRATLIARIEGTDPEAPSLCLLGHTDVVPVHEHRWTHDPFGGELIDGEVWGRGAIDMLNLTASMALAVRDLARDGFRPRGTLIYCAVADEEAFGHHGAEYVTTELADAVRADHLITESGGFPMPGEGGMRLPVLIGERGTLPTRLRVRGTPSHGSMPFMTDNALVKAGVVAQRLADHRPVPIIDEQWRGFVDGFGLDPALTGPLKEAEGFNELCAVLPPTIGRLAFSCTHTTIAPTMISAGSKLNIIPGEIELALDVRTLPGHGAEEVWAQIQDALGPELAADVDFLPGDGMPASSTPPGTPLWHALERTAQRFYEGSRLSPLLMPGATDARWWRRNLGTQCYGFGLFSERMSLEELGTMGHGDDERVDVESLRLVTEMWGVLARDFLG
jgi:acetylornithine deacetylase/succinyl-diaminopimelate desuccinylase-like protein